VRALVALPEQCRYPKTRSVPASSRFADTCKRKRLCQEDTRLWPPSPTGGRRDGVADGEFYPPAVRLRTSSEVGLTLLLTRNGCAQIQERWTVLLPLSRENSRTPVPSTGSCDTGPWAKRTQQNVSVSCKIVSVNTPAQVDSTRGKTVKHFFVLKKPLVDNNGSGISDDN
jgi:hypothetical protein